MYSSDMAGGGDQSSFWFESIRKHTVEQHVTIYSISIHFIKVPFAHLTHRRLVITFLARTISFTQRERTKDFFGWYILIYNSNRNFMYCHFAVGTFCNAHNAYQNWNTLRKKRKGNTYLEISLSIYSRIEIWMFSSVTWNRMASVTCFLVLVLFIFRRIHSRNCLLLSLQHHCKMRLPNWIFIHFWWFEVKAMKTRKNQSTKKQHQYQINFAIVHINRPDRNF